MINGRKEKYWQVERQGKFIVVNILDGDKYIPLFIFENLPQFHQWARNVADQCSSYAQLAEEIEKIYKGIFGEPEGQVWDYVKNLEKIDAIGER